MDYILIKIMLLFVIMKLSESENLMWFNGNLVKTKDANINVLTHSLHYGGGVFEGLRAYNGKIFKLNEHSERLIRSAEMIGMKIPYAVEEVNQATIKTVEVNKLKNCYIRPIALYDSTVLGVASSKCQVNLAIAVWEWPQYFSGAIKLEWSKWKRPSPESAPVFAKASGLYIIATMTKNSAESKDFQDGLMLDYRGYVAECSGANIFFVMDGKLHTPIADCFLNGITRQTVIELAKSIDIEVVERYIMPNEIEGATEVFVTGTAAEITSVAQIGTKVYSYGLITQKLQKLYDEQTGK